MLTKLTARDIEERSWKPAMQQTPSERLNSRGSRISHIERFTRLLRPGEGGRLRVADLGVRSKVYAKEAFIRPAAELRGIKIRYRRAPQDTIIFERVA